MEEIIILILKCLRCYEMLAVMEVGREQTLWTTSSSDVMDFANLPNRLSSSCWSFKYRRLPIKSIVCFYFIWNQVNRIFVLPNSETASQLRIREILLLFIPCIEVGLIFFLLRALWEHPRTVGMLAVQSASLISWRQPCLVPLPLPPLTWDPGIFWPGGVLLNPVTQYGAFAPTSCA